MSSTSVPHEERTAAEQREATLHHVKLARIDQVNDSIRLLRLHVSQSNQVKFRPGQWLDVHLPGVRQAGGFTITSTPKDAQNKNEKPGYLELAIQRSPKNPPAAWLWRLEKEILGSDVLVRVGGSFVWPPPGIDPTSIRRLVFVAGGVGVKYPPSKDPSAILFLDRLSKFFKHGSENHNFQLFLSQCSESEKAAFVEKLKPEAKKLEVTCGRISHQHLLDAIGPVEQRKGVVVYVCGVPTMTDEFVDLLRAAEGMEERRVLCEKWW
ncbi:MAG: hypothetical protein Q9222_005328 [Ikaeria aurantiellina]